MLEFTDLEKDAITEAFNIGMGHAGNSLSKMVNHEVQLSAPTVEFVSKNKACEVINNGQDGFIAGVSEKFTGPISGDAMLLLPEEKNLELVQLVLDDSVPKELLSQMEQEALSEVGNIILTGCLASLADMMQEEIESEIPVMVKGTVNDILDDGEDSGESIVMVLHMNFSIRDKDINGYVTFLMGTHSIENFHKELQKHFQLEGSA